MQELFRQNAYGDTWQEPELFDQPGLPAATLPEITCKHGFDPDACTWHSCSTRRQHRGYCHTCRAYVETPHYCADR